MRNVLHALIVTAVTSILSGCFSAKVVPILESRYPEPADKQTAFDVLLHQSHDSQLFQIGRVRAVVEINGQTYPMKRLGESIYSTYRYINKERDIPHDGEYRLRYSFHLTPYGVTGEEAAVNQYVLNYPPNGSIVRSVGDIRWSCDSSIRYSSSISSTSFGNLVVFDYVFEGPDPLGVQDRYENVTIENHGVDPVILVAPEFRQVGSEGPGFFSVVAKHFPQKIPAGQSYTFPVRYRRDMEGKPGTYRATAAMTVHWRRIGSDKKYRFGPIPIDATFHRVP